MVNETPHSVDEQIVAAAGAADGVRPAENKEVAAVPSPVPGAAPGKVLSPEAIRALQEAEARRVAAQEASEKEGGQKLPTEIGGRNGEDPTRYGDYEKKGIAVDF